MKKRVFCIILVFLLAFADISANANVLNNNNDVVDSAISTIIDELAGFSRIDRKNLLTIIYPMLSADAGVDALVEIIDNYEKGSAGIMGEYIDKVLQYTSKQKLISALNNLKIVPENIRDKYLKDYMERKEISLSFESMESMEFFMEVAYKKFPALKQIFAEDGITNNMVAHIFTILKEVNHGVPVIKADKDYFFAPYRIDDSLSARWKEILSINGVEGDMISKISEITEHFNKDYSFRERRMVALLFNELGVCNIANITEPNFKNIVALPNNHFSFPVVYAYVEAGKILFKTEFVDKQISPQPFSDIDGWYRDCVTELAYMGVVNGRGNGVFCPQDFVTREEFVKMICAAVNLAPVNTDIPFEDVDHNSWYVDYIDAAYGNGIIKGTSEKTFGVGQNITRQDAAVICSNILKDSDVNATASIAFDDADMVAPYAAESVKKLAGMGIINGDGTGKFNPRASITRAESAKIINELIYVISNLK